jgi:hypothetical protein
MTLKCSLCLTEFQDEAPLKEILAHFHKEHHIKNMPQLLEAAIILKLVGIP